jgi:uncharacterized phage protein (TIGR01671 family)
MELNRTLLFRGKSIDTGRMCYGLPVWRKNDIDTAPFICIDEFNKFDEYAMSSSVYPVHDYTIGQFTGFVDMDGKKIFDGDITELEMPDGSGIRRFLVRLDTVDRTVVNHPDFDPWMSKVRIRGVAFKWNGYDLAPCVDENGKSDCEKMMRVIGNIHDDWELLGVDNGTITEEESRWMIHAIGLDHCGPENGVYKAFRNVSLYYEPVPEWESLCGKQFAFRKDGGSEIRYSVTAEGAEKLGKYVGLKIVL